MAEIKTDSTIGLQKETISAQDILLVQDSQKKVIDFLNSNFFKLINQFLKASGESWNISVTSIDQALTGIEKAIKVIHDLKIKIAPEEAERISLISENLRQIKFVDTQARQGYIEKEGVIGKTSQSGAGYQFVIGSLRHSEGVILKEVEQLQSKLSSNLSAYQKLIAPKVELAVGGQSTFGEAERKQKNEQIAKENEQVLAETNPNQIQGINSKYTPGRSSSGKIKVTKRSPNLLGLLGNILFVEQPRVVVGQQTIPFEDFAKRLPEETINKYYSKKTLDQKYAQTKESSVVLRYELKIDSEEKQAKTFICPNDLRPVEIWMVAADGTKQLFEGEVTTCALGTFKCEIPSNIVKLEIAVEEWKYVKENNYSEIDGKIVAEAMPKPVFQATPIEERFFTYLSILPFGGRKTEILKYIDHLCFKYDKSNGHTLLQEKLNLGIHESIMATGTLICDSGSLFFANLCNNLGIPTFILTGAGYIKSDSKVFDLPGHSINHNSEYTFDITTMCRSEFHKSLTNLSLSECHTLLEKIKVGRDIVMSRVTQVESTHNSIVIKKMAILNVIDEYQKQVSLASAEEKSKQLELLLLQICLFIDKEIVGAESEEETKKSKETLKNFGLPDKDIDHVYSNLINFIINHKIILTPYSQERLKDLFRLSEKFRFEAIAALVDNRKGLNQSQEELVKDFYKMLDPHAFQANIADKADQNQINRRSVNNILGLQLSVICSASNLLESKEDFEKAFAFISKSINALEVKIQGDKYNPMELAEITLRNLSENSKYPEMLFACLENPEWRQTLRVFSEKGCKIFGHEKSQNKVVKLLQEKINQGGLFDYPFWLISDLSFIINPDYLDKLQKSPIKDRTNESSPQTNLKVVQLDYNQVLLYKKIFAGTSLHNCVFPYILILTPENLKLALERLQPSEMLAWETDCTFIDHPLAIIQSQLKRLPLDKSAPFKEVWDSFLPRAYCPEFIPQVKIQENGIFYTEVKDNFLDTDDSDSVGERPTAKSASITFIEGEVCKSLNLLASNAGLMLIAKKLGMTNLISELENNPKSDPKDVKKEQETVRVLERSAVIEKIDELITQKKDEVRGLLIKEVYRRYLPKESRLALASWLNLLRTDYPNNPYLKNVVSENPLFAKIEMLVGQDLKNTDSSQPVQKAQRFSRFFPDRVNYCDTAVDPTASQNPFLIFPVNPDPKVITELQSAFKSALVSVMTIKRNILGKNCYNKLVTSDGGRLRTFGKTDEVIDRSFYAPGEPVVVDFHDQVASAKFDGKDVKKIYGAKSNSKRVLMAIDLESLFKDKFSKSGIITDQKKLEQVFTHLIMLMAEGYDIDLAISFRGASQDKFFMNFGKKTFQDILKDPTKFLEVFGENLSTIKEVLRNEAILLKGKPIVREHSIWGYFSDLIVDRKTIDHRKYGLIVFAGKNEYQRATLADIHHRDKGLSQLVYL